MNKQSEMTTPQPHTFCQCCGMPLPAGAHKNTRYCSDACRKQAMHESAVRYAERKKRTMTPEEAAQQRKHNRDNYRRRREVLFGPRKCVVCGTLLSEDVKTNTKYCSDECRRKARSAYQIAWARKRREGSSGGHRHRRRHLPEAAVRGVIFAGQEVK